MNLTSWIIATLSCFAGLSLAQTPPSANVVSDSWKALQSEPSRMDLFKTAALRQRKAPNGVQSFVFPDSFLFPTDAELDISGKIRANSWFGIDISHHNGPNFPFQFALCAVAVHVDWAFE